MSEKSTKMLVSVKLNEGFFTFPDILHPFRHLEPIESRELFNPGPLVSEMFLGV
jgi:hypothetical protein